MGKFIDLTGQRFGRFTVMERGNSKNNEVMWLCRCDCGNEKFVEGHHLKDGTSKSCGCINKERFETHGKSNTRLFRIWTGMKQRCYNCKTQYYKIYGGHGIEVCEEWRNDFQTFYDWAMANGYSENLSIDRIDSDGNYEPLNCRWVTNVEQANNKRSNYLLELNGKIQTITKWSKEFGISTQTIKHRIKKLGWSVEKAITVSPNSNGNRTCKKATNYE